MFAEPLLCTQIGRDSSLCLAQSFLGSGLLSSLEVNLREPIGLAQGTQSGWSRSSANICLLQSFTLVCEQEVTWGLKSGRDVPYSQNGSMSPVFLGHL